MDGAQYIPCMCAASQRRCFQRAPWALTCRVGRRRRWHRGDGDAPIDGRAGVCMAWTAPHEEAATRPENREPLFSARAAFGQPPTCTCCASAAALATPTPPCPHPPQRPLVVSRAAPSHPSGVGAEWRTATQAKDVPCRGAAIQCGTRCAVGADSPVARTPLCYPVCACPSHISSPRSTARVHPILPSAARLVDRAIMMSPQITSDCLKEYSRPKRNASREATPTPANPYPAEMPRLFFPGSTSSTSRSRPWSA